MPEVRHSGVFPSAPRRRRQVSTALDADVLFLAGLRGTDEGAKIGLIGTGRAVGLEFYIQINDGFTLDLVRQHRKQM
jgi:hypothetical protein